MTGSPRYEMDFAYLKPKADLLLVGKCHAPGRDPVKACRVTFRVGSKSKSLGIFGKRSWKHDVIGMGAISEPRPFRTMELRYEKSYGGAEYKKNPVGKGYARSLDTVGIKGRYLPNIEDPDNLIETSGSHPQPSGFGPLNRQWELRHSRMGTYKGKYQKERWPWFPEDFDWSHFNAAPPEMQLEGYLHGDEELFFENLHKKHSNYTCYLPGLRVRGFVSKLIDEKSEEPTFLEVPLNLDTLWVNMEAEKLVLVWRGWTEIRSEEYDEIQHIFLISEPLAEQPQSIDHCNKLFLDTLAEEEEELELIPEEPDEEADETQLAVPILPDDDQTQLEIPQLDAGSESGADAIEVAQKAVDKNALLKQVEIQTAMIMAQLGLNMDILPAQVRDEMKKKQQSIVNKLSDDNPRNALETEQQEQQKQLQDKLSQLGIDYNNLPPLSEKAKLEQSNFLQAIGMKEGELTADAELTKSWQVMAALLPGMGIDPENLNPLIKLVKPKIDQIKKQLGLEFGDAGKIAEESKDEAQKKAAEVSREDTIDIGEIEKLAESEAAIEEGSSILSREVVKDMISRGDSLAGMDLSGLDFSEMDLTGVDLSGAIMADAILIGANLSDTDLKGASLSGGDFSNAKLENADLQDADLSGGNLSGVNMSGAKLNDTLFEKAKMDNAILDRVEAKDTIFTEADLSGASFKNAELSGSDFSHCLLDGADFQAANLSEASVEGAKGQKVNFREADLTKLRASEKCEFTEGIFNKVNGRESIWHEANLKSADFSFANMEGADFSKAKLERATLSAANMRFSRFIKANLKEAKMLLLNLFEGSLEKADLTGADLSGANLYAVEFLDTVTEKTILNRANLKMTKLEKK